MPKVSKETASLVQDAGVMVGRYAELGEFTVGFETFREDADSAPVLRGLPDDRCQAQHWGYVIEGRITFRYADGEETFEAGDAYVAKPGHTTLIAGGTELVDFAPTKEVAKTFAAIERNLAVVS
jgi:uncharacterized cupin superfamily protein